MHFAEADQEYRTLEKKLLDGELLEDDFLVQVAQLRVVDQGGRRWMLSPRTGRWMVHDGQQWVFAEPPRERIPPEAEKIESAETDAVLAAAPTAGSAPPTPAPAGPKPVAPRLLATGLTALLLVACVISAGISAWVFFLRDWGAVTPTSVRPTQVGRVQTYTPRPATPTYTPTFTPTPSRTPTPTITPIPTHTPPPTNTSPPTHTPGPVNSPTPTWTPLVLATTKEPTVAETTPTPTATSTPPPSQTYTVKVGDTLFEIAQRFGVTVDAIAKANGITNVKLIRPGQVLVIPPPGTTPQPPTSTPTAQPTTAAAATSTPRTTPATTVAGVSPTPTATSATPTPGSTATPSGPAATPNPTNTPVSAATSTAAPTATPTSQPAVLSGKIAFTVWNPYIGKYELYVSHIDGSGRNRLGEGFRQPQFRQDGNLLAANGDGAPNYEHLVTMNANGGDLREVSLYSEDSYPTWSPDGAIVAFSSDSWGDGQVRLGVVNDMFGMQQDWISYGQTEIRGQFPFWMADGRVVYNGCDFMGDQAACGLYRVGAGGGRYQRLTSHTSDTAPAGAGSRVAFMSARDGNWEIYAVNIDGSGLKRLTQNNAQDGLPTWSPDGKSLAFISNRGGAWAIWVMNADGSNQRKLFDLGGGYGSGEYDWTFERISWAP